jgi:hypothetical protein
MSALLSSRLLEQSLTGCMLLRVAFLNIKTTASRSWHQCVPQPEMRTVVDVISATDRVKRTTMV